MRRKHWRWLQFVCADAFLCAVLLLSFPLPVLRHLSTSFSLLSSPVADELAHFAVAGWNGMLSLSFLCSAPFLHILLLLFPFLLHHILLLLLLLQRLLHSCVCA